MADYDRQQQWGKCGRDTNPATAFGLPNTDHLYEKENRTDQFFPPD